MAELIASIAVALVELIAAAIQVCIQAVALVLESLGFAVGHLAEEPKKGERRFTAKRLMVAFAPLAVVAMLVIGAISYSEWRAHVRRERERETEQRIDVHVKQLAGRVDENGRMKRHPAALLDVHDAWGNQLRVKYETTFLHESVTVSSDGVDEDAGTADDLSSSRQILLPGRDMAKGAIEKAKEAISDQLLHRDRADE